MIRRVVLSAVLGIGVAGAVWGSEPSSTSRAPASPSKPDRSYGTALQWESNADAAAKKAERQRKLVMVLAVAGHFDDPFFT